MLEARRQTLRLPKPAVQLKLPLLLLVVTMALGALMAWHTHAAYQQLFDVTMSSVAPAFREDIREQTDDYLVVSSAILGGYVLLVIGLCIAYTHRLIGPTVALGRQARKLRAGDFSARTHLRRGDTVFTELASDMNAVAELLEKHAGSASTSGWRS